MNKISNTTKLYSICRNRIPEKWCAQSDVFSLVSSSNYGLLIPVIIILKGNLDTHLKQSIYELGKSTQDTT